MSRRHLLLFLPLLVCFVIGVMLVVAPQGPRAPSLVDPDYPVAMPSDVRALPLPDRLRPTTTGPQETTPPGDWLPENLTSPDDTPAVTDPPTGFSLTVTVIEEGGASLLADAEVRLAREEEAGWLTATTNADGIAVFPGLTAGHYTPSVSWGGVTYTSSLPVIMAGADRARTLVFPARTAFQMQLIDHESAPLAHTRLRAGPYVRRVTPDVLNRLQPVVTDAQGRFTLRGYKGTTDFMVLSEQPALLRLVEEGTTEDSGRPWSNPLWLPSRTMPRLGSLSRIVMRRDLIEARATIVGGAPLGPGESRMALIVGNHVDSDFYPVVDDELTFMGWPGDVVVIQFTRYPDYVDPAVLDYRRMARREFSHVQRLPSERGLFEFEIPYPNAGQLADPVTITGHVLTPDNTPVAGVGVTAMAMGEWMQVEDLPRRAQPLARSGLRTMTHAGLTDADGAFSLALPEGDELLLLINPATIPKGMFNRQSLRRARTALASGEPLILHLEYQDLIWGEVIDADGVPVANADLRVLGWGAPPGIRSRVRSDSEGFFEIDVERIPDFVASSESQHDLPQIYVLATTRDGRAGWAPTLLNLTEPTRVVLLPSSRVTLHVRQPGRVVRFVRVRARFEAREVQQASWRTELQQHFSDDGSFELGTWPRGITNLLITLPDGSEHTLTIPPNAPSRWQVTLSVP
jgi:hypothetical protein